MEFTKAAKKYHESSTLEVCVYSFSGVYSDSREVEHELQRGLLHILLLRIPTDSEEMD